MARGRRRTKVMSMAASAATTLHLCPPSRLQLRSAATRPRVSPPTSLRRLSQSTGDRSEELSWRLVDYDRLSLRDPCLGNGCFSACLYCFVGVHQPNSRSRFSPGIDAQHVARYCQWRHKGVAYLGRPSSRNGLMRDAGRENRGKFRTVRWLLLT